ncbi:MAG: DNA polymerase IV [Rhodospirillales bacterium]
MLNMCRDCAAVFEREPLGGRCPHCGGSRFVAHDEIGALSIAHIDCDAFYASVEKRDDPALQSKPVIVGGGRRGVVAACCYVARIHGIHSAMPMFQARKLCPDAVVIRPNIEKYRDVGRRIRGMMRDLTPLVEPLSLDEAFLDLTGTARLHKASPAQSLIKLVNRIEREVGVTASIGLSYNKFLAKIASDLDKPRGFAVIGRAEALDFLASKPVKMLWGAGKVLCRQLEKDGIRTIGELRAVEKATLFKRYGSIGNRLYAFARGEDDRTISPDSEPKSISNETTFEADVADVEELKRRLWPLCEKVAGRLRRAGLATAGITLKLKTARFKSLTRACRLAQPTQLAEALYRGALPLLEREADGTAFRLIGIGAGRLLDGTDADRPDLADQSQVRTVRIEQAIDRVREKFGADALSKGRGFTPHSKR